MDSSTKPNKRSKLPPTNTRQPIKSSHEGPLHNSENRLRAIVSPTMPNRPQSSVSKDRKRTKDQQLNISMNLNEVTNTGKENKSQSPLRKKSKTKQNNQSMIQGYVVKKDLQVPVAKSRKTSPEKSFLNTSTEKVTKMTQKKTPSRQSVSNSVTLHRRYNSSVVGHHSRSQSNERKSIPGSRNANNVNSSLLNNSLLENPLDYSREFSYLKEYDTSEFVHYGDIVGYNSSYSSNVKAVGSNERLNPGFTILHDDNFGNTHIEEEIEQEELSGASTPFAKGKAYFKQKRYREAIEQLKDSPLYKEGNKKTLYLLGVSYLWLCQYENAKIELSKLIEKENSTPKCSTFILLSIVYKKLDDITLAIRTLTKAITKYPERSDIYIFRAKLYLKAKNWERAFSDFKRAVEIDPTRGIGYIGKGDASRMLGEYEEAVHYYSEAAEKQRVLVAVALLKRAIALAELKRYSEAASDLDTVIQEDPKHSEAYYFKGIVLSKKGDNNEAILCFEQAIKHNSSIKAVVKSLYEIARIKIEGRNFYEAYHTIHRAGMMNLDQSYFTKLKLFTEGVIYLMKKKFDEGVNNLTNVLKHNLSASFIPMIYSYRAYGHFCLGKHKKALQDYQEVQKLSKLEKSSLYNKLLCEGILAAEVENFEKAEENFEKSLKVYPNKMEPYFYKACLSIQAFCKTRQKSDKTKLANCLSTALKDIEKALEINENCSNLYYIKALILYTLGYLDLAFASIEKAIEKADENYAKYYFLKGCIYGAAGNYYNAVSDISIALSINKNYNAAYLERGKCYFGLRNLKQAFLDIQKYISSKGNNPNIHLWAGNLLFSTGAYEDASRAYSNSENINKSETLLCLRAKCYLTVKELNLALNDLNRLVDLQTPNNIHYYIDKECLGSLKLASTTKDGEDTLDKVNIVKAIQNISKILSYKMSGDIFHLDDIYFYKSVLHFYLKEYEQALDDLDTAWGIRQELMEIYNEKKSKKNLSEDHIKITEDASPSQNGQSIDYDEERRASFTKPEYFYNKAIYLLMLSKYNESVAVLEVLKTLITSATAHQRIDSLIKLILIQALRGPKDKDPINDPSKNKTQEISVFAYFNRLCSIFPNIRLPFASSQVYETRLSFCLPNVEPPVMTPTISQDIVEEITVLSVENRPEAPWIKRNPEGIIFTEDFLRDEYKDIDNLQEVIAAHGLKEEEVYRSLGNSQKILENANEDQETDEVIEYGWKESHNESSLASPEEINKSMSVGARKIRRSNT